MEISKCLFGKALRQETITDPGFCLDVFFAAIAFELASKLSNEDSQVLWLVDGLSTPHRCEENTVSYDLPRLTGKMQQQVKFFRCQVNGLSIDGDGMVFRRDCEVS